VDGNQHATSLVCPGECGTSPEHWAWTSSVEIASGIGRKMGGKIWDFYGFLKKLGEDRPPKDLTWDLRW